MHARNASNVLKTVSKISVRNGSNVLKTVSKISVRNGSNVLKTAYTTAAGGGGGGGGAPTVSIAPTVKSTTSSTSYSNTSDFVATFSSTPTSIVWSVDSVDAGGSCTLISGQSTATGRFTLTIDPAYDYAGSTIRCTAVIGGVTVYATAEKDHSFYVPEGSS